MRFFGTKRPPALAEELVQRVWDCSSRLKQLEDRFDASLEELSVRYRRAEQSEQRLEKKRNASPCDDDDDGLPDTIAKRAFAYGSKQPTSRNGALDATDTGD